MKPNVLCFLASVSMYLVYCVVEGKVLPREYNQLNAFEQIVEKQGYVSETHTVTTEDGYILTIHRIPKTSKTGPPTKGVVLILHGVLSSSVDWVVMGQNKALTFLLSDAGYDVWLGNNRGNTFSRNHILLDPDEEVFWDFSWDEMGRYDLPAIIDYILNETGENTLNYVGHSQGTTTFFVMAAEKPEYNNKIKLMQAMAPVVYLSHASSPLVQIPAPITTILVMLMRYLHLGNLIPSTDFVTRLRDHLCNRPVTAQLICMNFISLAFDFDKAEQNKTALMDIFENTPAGGAVKEFYHYAQEVVSGKFRRYDYGASRNYELYGSSTPPDYPIRNIVSPVILHYADNDWLVNVKDVEILVSQLPNLIRKIKVPYPKWNHMDYMWGIDADKFVYAPIIEMLDRFNNGTIT